MIIYLKGADSFRAVRVIREIKEKYQEKSKGGFELYQYDEDFLPKNLADLTAESLFGSTRLVVFKRAAGLPIEIQEELGHYLERIPSSTIVVVWDSGEPSQALTSKLSRAEKIVDVSRPDRAVRRSLVRQELKRTGLEIADADLESIVAQESDIWQTVRQAKIAALGGTIDLHVQDTGNKKFVYFNLFSQGNDEAIVRQIATDYRSGRPLDPLIGELTAAVKKYVSKLDSRIRYIDLLISLDFGRKTSRLNDRNMIGLLSAYLANKTLKPLQWEKI